MAPYSPNAAALGAGGKATCGLGSACAKAPSGSAHKLNIQNWTSQKLRLDKDGFMKVESVFLPKK